MVYNEEGGVHPHTSASLIRHEGVGHVNWTLTCNTMADKERAGGDTRRGMMWGSVPQQLDLYFTETIVLTVLYSSSASPALSFWSQSYD